MQHKTGAKEDLIERIQIYLAESGLQADDKLPSERQLCAMWSVNRSTLRAAIAHLQELGLIYSAPGLGNFVRSGKLERMLDDMDSFQDVAEKQKKAFETIVLRQGLIKSDISLSKRLRIDPGASVFELVRLRYVDAVAASLE
ncbi:MAG: GntR family transcriptional regulator, partial [Eubacteriales bacterium]|nr:GntR family transcriptional regulator [Eubacteriales bacterium]